MTMSTNKHQHKTNTDRMVLDIPVTYCNGDIPIWLCKRNCDYNPIINNNRTKATRCSLKIERWEVEKAPNLIFHLKLVRPIAFWMNWTICAKNTILPRVTPHLNPRPATNINPKYVKGHSKPKLMFKKN